MSTHPLVLHCDFSDEGPNLVEVLSDAFLIFLQKELHPAPLPEENTP